MQQQTKQTAIVCHEMYIQVEGNKDPKNQCTPCRVAIRAMEEVKQGRGLGDTLVGLGRVVCKVEKPSVSMGVFIGAEIPKEGS